AVAGVTVTMGARVTVWAGTASTVPAGMVTAGMATARKVTARNVAAGAGTGSLVTSGRLTIADAMASAGMAKEKIVRGSEIRAVSGLTVIGVEIRAVEMVGVRAAITVPTVHGRRGVTVSAVTASAATGVVVMVERGTAEAGSGAVAATRVVMN